MLSNDFPFVAPEVKDIATDGIELNEQYQVVLSNGLVASVLGFTFTIYIRQGDTPEIRTAMIRAYERYVELMGPVFKWCANPDTFEPESVKDTSFGDVRAWPKTIFERYDFLMMFHGGDDLDDASDHSFMAVSRERFEGQLSFLSVSFPLRWVEQNSLDAFVSYVRDVCNSIKPAHGYGGLAALAPLSGLDKGTINAVYTLAQRFQGLEIDMPVHHEGFLTSERRIKTVNWLTIIDESYIEKAGGMKLVGNKLGYLPIYPLENGIIIQAGPLPLLGDSKSGTTLVNYEQVAQALYEIRSINPAMIWPQDDECFFGFEEAQAWMTRFDKPRNRGNRGNRGTDLKS